MAHTVTLLKASSEINNLYSKVQSQIERLNPIQSRVERCGSGTGGVNALLVKK